MKETWRTFYEKAEDGFRKQYASRFTPPDGVNKRYKVIDFDLNKSWVVDNYSVASKILTETLRRNHQTTLMEV